MQQLFEKIEKSLNLLHQNPLLDVAHDIGVFIVIVKTTFH